MALSILALLLNATIAAAGVVLCLYTLAARLGFDIELHKLSAETKRLRMEYSAHLSALRKRDAAIEVELLSTAGPDGPTEMPGAAP